MAYITTYQDAVVPISYVFGEQWANAALYNVIGASGGACALTYNGGNMTVALASGNVTHNGIVKTVASNATAYTLVSDPSHPRWTWLAIDSSGSPQIVSGTPAAAPAIPALGDYVAVGLVYVDTGLTIANNASYKLDMRLPGPENKHLHNYTNATQTVSASTTYADVVGAVTTGSATSKFSFDAAASTNYLVDYYIPMTFTSTGGAKFQVTGPASPTSVTINGERGIGTDNGTSGALILNQRFATVSAFASDVSSLAAAAAASGATVWLQGGSFIHIRMLLINGSTAGAVTLQIGQNTAAGTAVIGIGATMDVVRL